MNHAAILLKFYDGERVEPSGRLSKVCQAISTRRGIDPRLFFPSPAELMYLHRFQERDTNCKGRLEEW